MAVGAGALVGHSSTAAGIVDGARADLRRLAQAAVEIAGVEVEEWVVAAIEERQPYSTHAVSPATARSMDRKPSVKSQKSASKGDGVSPGSNLRSQSS